MRSYSAGAHVNIVVFFPLMANLSRLDVSANAIRSTVVARVAVCVTAKSWTSVVLRK